jgi:peptidoglycan/LPS O-acetylase OafA/YrhL
VNFRQDINGLRAIAVIAVVLYHFNSEWLTGGFAGVDVFFVISGFLMTGIIFRRFEQNNFSLGHFYMARAKRIIPALAMLSLFLLIVGWFYLSPAEYSQLGKHVASSMGFLSNIIYWKESGYFDTGSNEKWLLHTWSLSVEWQFYIIYPMVLVFLKRFFTLNILRYIILIACVLGFIFSVWVTYLSPRSAFFLLPTRSWEMLLGGVAYLFPLALKDRNKKSVELIGIMLIAISYFALSSKDLWPGYLALFPVIGAFLVIQSSRDNSLFTNNILFQKIGTYSYSIYL